MSARDDGPVEPDSRPYESLYRHGNPTPPERTDPGWARHSGILHDPADSPEGDRYAWLFRSDDPAPAHAAVEPDVEEDTRPRLRPVAATPPTTAPARRPESLSPTAQPQPTDRELTDPEPVDPEPVDPEPVDPEPTDRKPRRRRGLLVTVLLLVVLLVVGAAWVVRDGLGTAGPTSTSPASTASGSRPPATTSAQPSGSASTAYDGTVTAVAPTAVAADCTAADATDDGGKKVSYAAGQTVDGDLATAWRCNGAGTREQLTFDLPAGTTVAELGLVNGYTKVDPASDKDRYGEYRRILQVTWTVGDRQMSQTLSGSDEKVQVLRIPPTPADRVVLTIDKASAPGSKAATRDAVLISEATVGAPA